MKVLLHPSLARRVLIALLAGLLIAWAAFVGVGVLTLKVQQRHDQRDFGNSPVGLQVRDALQAIDEPAQAVTIVSAIDRIGSGQRVRGNAPTDVLMQLTDRRDHTILYASPGLGSGILRGNPQLAGVQLIHGRPYWVFGLDTPRWAVLWARTYIDYPWVILLVGRDVISRIAIAIPCLLLPLWFAVWQGLRPLRRLSASLAGRGPDDTSPIGQIPDQLEMRPLVAALDGLLARMRRKILAERDFVGNAAHELRMPLAVMTTEAHVLSKPLEGAQRADARVRLEAAAARASHLVHQLLTLARMDMEQGAERIETDLARLAREEIAYLVSSATGREIELSLESPDCLAGKVDLQLFRSVLQNLVDNAIRYGKRGGRVVVTLSSAGDRVVLSVADDGRGIPEPDRTRVFERFFRAANARDTEGTGLGLAIAQRAATDLHGTLSITDGLGGTGCCFVLEMPGLA
jgi:signal transduction histidine kinase